MTTNIDTGDVCCTALELSKTSWVCAFAAPGDSQAIVHKIKAGDVDRLIGILNSSKAKAEHRLGRPLHIVLCYEVGYDGFWLARFLIARGIRTIVFDPASFLMPRRGRRAKTDRIDAEGMTRTLRTWLSGDREVARDVQIPSVEQEDAKRIERERKNLIEKRTSIVGRIKGLLALHGIWLTGKRIGKGLRERLDTMRTGDGRPLAPFLRRDIERMLRHYDFVSQQIEEVVADRKKALADRNGRFPQAEKVQLLATLGAVGETTATVLVAEVYHRSFETRRHVASFIGLAPSPYNSGDTDRDRGISKAGTKLARQTLVELAWFWLRYQPNSKLSLWWHERFGNMGMRGRKVGIVALARKLAIALWRFVEQGVVPEGATLKA
ncbi:MAG: IS110 family transposase [Candidatus Sulfotelmatobacter sp.]